jgi:uncharacterized protein (TIGR03083 family)
MGTEERWQVVVEQRLALAELLAGLSGADWEQPSLCAGWRVRDVAAHVTLIPIPPSPGSLLVDFAKARGNYGRFNTLASRRRAARTPTEIVQDFRTSAESRSVPRIVNPANVMWDILVHAQDIRDPAGNRLPHPARRRCRRRYPDLGPPLAVLVRGQAPSGPVHAYGNRRGLDHRHRS